MLSIANISAGMSASYYEKDDYYSKESTENEGRAYSRWYGKLADELGLKNEVDLKDFDNLLKGKVTDTVILGKISKNGEKKHSAGIDLTFSAPKSVSILAEIGGDSRIYKAHEKSIATALKFVEEECVRTRIRRKDELSYLKSDNIAIATFRHNTSRNLDPQLHTHCVVINATKDNNGKFRSAEFYKVFSNKKLIGKVYRNELSKNLKELGYEVEKIHKDGRFELKEINVDIRKAFSTRRIEIEKSLSSFEKNNGEEKTAKDSAKATLLTRQAKKDVDKFELKKEWTERINNFGVDLNKIIENAKFKDKSITSNKEIKQITSEAVRFAISNLSEKEAVFERNQLINSALSFSDTISLKDIQQEIKNHISNGDLILRGEKLIPKNNLILEKENIKLLQGGQVMEVKILETFKMETLNNTLLNQGQKESIHLIVSTKDRIVGIQGSAGTGKTYMLNEARKIVEKEGYSFLGMAPSNSATITLKEDARLTEAHTLQKFLKKYEGLVSNKETSDGLFKMQNDFKNKIIVVDESSMISSKQMNSLLKITDKLRCKVVLVGDTKQLASVEAGKPFYDLQKAGMKTAIMDEIIRQKDLILKEAVKNAIKGDIKEAFEKIGNNIVEKGKNEKISEIAIKEYFKLSKEDRKDTLLLSPSNNLRKEINYLARNILQEKKEISNLIKINQETFESKHLSLSEKSQHFSYEKGEYIIFNTSYKKHNICKNDNFEIKAIKENCLVLEKDNKQIEFSLKGSKLDFEIFKKSEKEIALGEEIRYLRNDKERGIVNSHTAKVININFKESLIVLQEKNQTKTLKFSDPILKHIDYAYSSTAYASQGKTVKNVIAVLESNTPLTNQQTFYVEISRAKEKAILIVDNKAEVQRSLEKNNGIKLSTLDYVNLESRNKSYDR
jgi:conjugative relaxase-like TrwC/TraI family protein